MKIVSLQIPIEHFFNAKSTNGPNPNLYNSINDIFKKFNCDCDYGYFIGSSEYDMTGFVEDENLEIVVTNIKKLVSEIVVEDYEENDFGPSEER